MKNISNLKRIRFLYTALMLFYLTCSGGKEMIKTELDEKITRREQETGVQIARKTIVDSSTWVDGRFTIGTKQRRKLLYGFPAPSSTSHVIFNIDGNFVSNEPNFKASYLLGPQRIDDYSYEVSWNFRKISLKQRLTPMLKNDKGMVWIQYFIKNKDKVPHSVGVQLELDTMIGSNDAAALASSSGIIERETQYSDEAVPDFFQAYEQATAVNTLTGQGLLYSAGATPPDFMIAGDWGRLNSVLWDEYKSRPRHYGDSAVLYRWDSQKLMPGDSLHIGTYYGLGSSFSGKFEDLVVKLCGPGEINTVNDELVPNPFEIVVIAINTGNIPLNNLMANINLPDGIQLVPGQTTPKNFKPQRLTNTMMGSVAWKLEMTKRPLNPKHFDLSVEVSHANSRSNPAVLSGNLKFDPEFKIEPALDIQLIMAGRSNVRQVRINHLQIKLTDDETNEPIPECAIHITNADTSYTLQTDANGASSLAFGQPMNSFSKFNFDINLKGYLPHNRTEELGHASGNIALKNFKLIRDTFEFSGLLKSDKADEVVEGGRLLLTNPDTTIEIVADEQGHFGQIMKKRLQPEQNSYTLTVYSANHFLFIKNIDFYLPRTFKQQKQFVIPYLQKGAKAILYNVFHEQYRYLLSIQTFPELLRSAACLKEHPNVIIEIGGHTSSPGSTSYNLWLSERRAEAAMDFYRGLGIPDSLLKAKGYGEAFPIATNLTRDGQAQNRRVELKVLEILP